MQSIESRLPNRPISNPGRRNDILLLIFSGLGVIGLCVRGAYLATTAIIYFDPAYGVNLASSMLDAYAMLFCACLLLPVVIYTIRRLKENEILPAVIQPIKFWQGLAIMGIWVLVVIIGTVIASLFIYGWVLAAPLFLLGISLPIILLVWIGAGGMPVGSRRRIWSVFGYGMVGGTITALLLEYLLIAGAVVIVGFLASVNPELRTVVDQIKTQVANANSSDLQALLTILAPYLTNPLVIVTILIFAAVLAPLIEEASKPAIIWFLGKRLHSPAEGFALGALCGAGFAMLEGLMSMSGATQMWGFGLAGRFASSLMHITGSGLMGWAIVSYRLEKSYKRLVLTYILSVCIHGVWNGSAILTVFGALRTMGQNTQVDLLGMVLMLGGVGMLILELVLMLIALPVINRRLRLAFLPAQVQSDIIAPLVTIHPRKNDGLDTSNN